MEVDGNISRIEGLARRLRGDRAGASGVEYAIVVGLVALAIIVGALFTGNVLGTLFNTIGDLIDSILQQQ